MADERRMAQEEITDFFERIAPDRPFRVVCEDGSKATDLRIQARYHRRGDLEKVVVQSEYKIYRKSYDQPWMMVASPDGSIEVDGIPQSIVFVG